LSSSPEQERIARRTASLPGRPMHAPAEPATPALFQHPPFFRFWWARVLTTLAFQMQAVALGWQIYDLTGNVFDLGLVGLVQFAPVLPTVLLVGHIADRHDRRVIIRVCQAAESAAALLLALGSVQGWLTPALILMVVLVVGTARAFELPSTHALVPALVPVPQLSRAVAAYTSAHQVAVIVGPALGGFLYLAGPATVYATCAVAFLLASILNALVRIPYTAPPPQPFSMRSLLAGFRFIGSRQALIGVISLDLFAVLLGGATALLPVFARDILVTGPWGLGMLRAAPAAGALTASLVLARRPLRRRVGKIMFAAVATFGLATIAFSLSRSLPLSLAVLAVLGAADSVSVVIRFSLVQLQTPDEMRGRVSAINAMFTGTSNTLGEFESGLTAALFGTVPSVLLGGLATVLIALVWMRAFPALLRVDSLEHGAARG
jgi:MFS family permease